MAEITAPVPSATAASPRATGILPYQAINAMRRGGEILADADILPEQLQPASIDLRLGAVAYRVQIGRASCRERV